MAKASTGDREFKVVPQGVHLGRCYRVIDLGTQETEFQGKSRKSRKVLLSWELFGEDEAGNPLEMDDGRPLSISKRYTLSLSEKSSLRADLEAWRGRAFTEDELQGFDLQNLLGVYALINVTHSTKGDKTYSNVAGLSPIPKQMRDHRPAPINENQFFNVEQPDMALFETFSDSLKNTISSCEEWKKPALEKKNLSIADMEDSVPF